MLSTLSLPVQSLTRIGVFLTVLGAGLPMGLALATGVFAPWLQAQGATPQSIGAEWRSALAVAGLLLVAGVALTLAAQYTGQRPGSTR
ncbi:MAG: hypothetical protein ACKVS8_12490 [Phycisphaerales bacterium]